VLVWARAGREVLELPDLRSDSIDTEPALTPDGRYLCFASDRAGGAGGFDLYLYDLMTRTFVPLVNVNTASHERNPSLSTDGRVITFESNRDGGFGKIDLWNHDRTSSQTGQPGGFSSAGDDVQPWLRWR
jgi:Tol biopolymer transport system component